VGEEPAYVLPEVPELAAPTVAEVARALSAEFLRPVRGAEEPSTRREVGNVIVGAMSLPHFLEHIRDGDMIITPGDRADLIVGSLASRFSGTYPNIAGLVLTGGLVPEPSVLKLIDGLGGTDLPLLATGSDTYRTAATVAGVRGVLTPESERKIAAALGVFSQHVDRQGLLSRLEVTRTERVTPLMFEQRLVERAKADRRHIVLPEGGDDRILRAAEQVLLRRIADLTVLGDPDAIRHRGAALGLELEGLQVSSWPISPSPRRARPPSSASSPGWPCSPTRPASRGRAATSRRSARPPPSPAGAGPTCSSRGRSSTTRPSTPRSPGPSCPTARSPAGPPCSCSPT
jgi:phosphate acetyltransferase